VVAEGDRVRSGREQAVGQAGRDPDTVRGVLTVHDAGADSELLAKRPEPGLECAAARRAHDVRDEEDAQRGAF
jgi:hypothetical protein